MTWSNLLSGLIGAMVGGVFSFVATVITIRNERWQVRQGASYAASTAIVDNIMTIDETMGAIQWAMDPRNDSPDPNTDYLFKTLHVAARRILYIYNVLIADEQLQSRISNLVDMVDVWYQNAQETSATVNEKRIRMIETYMDYVNRYIQAHLNHRSPPAEISPPDLLAKENA